MGAADWLRVIDEAKGLGVAYVQFIGGEPTMHPDFPAIVRHTADAGLGFEVYTNLVHVTAEVRELLQHPKATLAFSYYSAEPGGHNTVTGRPSHAATRRNAVRAVQSGIRVRAGVIDVGNAARAKAAQEDLRAMGITRISTDRVRQVGRGGPFLVTELCGHCGDGVAAVGPDGEVWPCVFARTMAAGNVRTARLADILSGPAMASALASIPAPRVACEPEGRTPGFPPTQCDPRS